MSPRAIIMAWALSCAGMALGRGCINPRTQDVPASLPDIEAVCLPQCDQPERLSMCDSVCLVEYLAENWERACEYYAPEECSD